MAKTTAYTTNSAAGQGSSRSVVRLAKPMRAQFVFPDGFAAKDKYGNYPTLQSGPDGSVEPFDFPFGPKDLKYDQFSPKFQELSRPFKKPLLVSDSSSLRTLSFNAVIADKESGGKLSIIELLDRLEAIADSGAAFQFKYGLTALPFSVMLTKFSYSVSYRMLDGSPSRAEVSIQLTESVFANQDLTILKAVYRDPTVTPNIASPTTAPVDTVEPDPTLYTIDPEGEAISRPVAEDANKMIEE